MVCRTPLKSSYFRLRSRISILVVCHRHRVNPLQQLVILPCVSLVAIVSVMFRPVAPEFELLCTVAIFE